MKVVKFLENKGVLLKETTRKIANHEGRFLHFLRPLMTAGLPLMKNLLTIFAKSVLLPLSLTARMIATDPAFQKKILGLGTTALIISNKEIEGIIKIVIWL